MLLRVGIDPAGLEQSPTARSIGRAFLAELANRSVLIHENGGRARLLAALKTHGNDSLNRVVELLLSARSRSEELPAGVPGLDSVVSLGDLTRWKGRAHLVLLTESKVAAFQREGGSENPELAAFNSAADSLAVETLAKRWDSSLEMGVDRDWVWERHFKPFAKRCREVYVVERELGHVLFDDILAKRRNPRLTEGGPAWFIHRLAEAGVRRVHIATSEARVRDKGFAAGAVLQTIKEWPQSQGWALEVDLALVPGAFQHQREFSFEGWAGFSVHNGLQTFDNIKLSEQAELKAVSPLAERVHRKFDQLKMKAR
ncbi:hypothetical protein [Aquipuribacter sp. MA13-6]|uniref:hypothetical protein n=1 Tax=unclassified Aquipuribacter TaxID=2635084 RepID=UPI003EEFEFA8